MTIETLEQRITAAATDLKSTPLDIQRALFLELREALEQGKARSAEPVGTGWKVNRWVKEGILMGFRSGVLIALEGNAPDVTFVEKDTVPPRHFAVSDGVRVVPGGSSVRRGAYVSPGVTIMPPAYINIGAYVDRDTMVDSHALVGSCAQIGKGVHLSAAAQIGGVLEPVGAMPVIIEDNVMVGGNCGIYEGVIVRRGAIIATGAILNASTVVYDIVNEKILRATTDHPLEIPAGAVVVPGIRLLKGDFAQAHGLGLQSPVIIKYRDEKTDGRTALESALRGV